MFWLVTILLLLGPNWGVEGLKQEEPSCTTAAAQTPPGNLASSEDSCLSKEAATNVCSGEVQLQNVLEAGLEERCKEEEMNEDKTSDNKGEKMKKDEEKMKSGCLFLLETSTRKVLTSREACALESAARNSGLLFSTNTIDSKGYCIYRDAESPRLDYHCHHHHHHRNRHHQNYHQGHHYHSHRHHNCHHHHHYFPRKACCYATGGSHIGLERQHHLPCLQSLQVDGGDGGADHDGDAEDHDHEHDDDHHDNDHIFSESASILHIEPKAFAAGTQLEDFFDGLALRESSYRWITLSSSSSLVSWSLMVLLLHHHHPPLHRC